MSDEEAELEDEMGVAAAFTMGVVVGFAAIVIVSAAVAWHAASVAAEGVQTVRRLVAG